MPHSERKWWDRARPGRISGGVACLLAVFFCMLAARAPGACAGQYFAPSEIHYFHDSIEAVVTKESDMFDKTDLQLRFYIIYGQDLGFLKSQLADTGPVDNNGLHRTALLHWHIKWHWSNDEEGRPKAESFTVEHKSELKLPFWMGQPNARDHMLYAWRKYYRALLAHEKRHYLLAQEYAKKIETELRDMIRSNPDISPREINHEVSGRLKELRLLNDEFDSKTDHGKADGVELGG